MKPETAWKINGVTSLFRFITPVMVTISIFILSQIWMQVADMNAKLYAHAVNDQIHTPKSEIVSLRADILEMRREVIATIRNEKRL